MELNPIDMLSESIDRLRTLRDLSGVSSDTYTALDQEIDKLTQILTLLCKR